MGHPLASQAPATAEATRPFCLFYCIVSAVSFVIGLGCSKKESETNQNIMIFADLTHKFRADPQSRRDEESA